MNVEFAGALLRPNFRYMAENKEKAESIFEAAKQAGSQIVKKGKDVQRSPEGYQSTIHHSEEVAARGYE